MLKYLFGLLFVILHISPILAQDTKIPAPVSNFRIDGQLGVSTNGKAFFVCFGGPNIRFQHKKVGFGVSIYPSLRILEDAPRTLITPTLGIGAYLFYKKLGIFTPLYYNSPKNEWSLAVGLCYKLGK